MSWFKPILSEEDRTAIRNYKYQGTDNSIWYNYVGSPQADYLVQKLPLWLAPNVVSCFGLLCNIIICAFSIYYSGMNANTPMSWWSIHICGCLYYMYYTFDNMDGKQAKRTKASSCLGMLVDHGCDALTTFIFTTGLCTIIQCDSLLHFSLVWIMTCVPFYFKTWEAHYTGRMDLPILSGVAEGCVVACCFMHAVAYFGIDWLLEEYTIPIINTNMKLRDSLIWLHCLVGVSFAPLSVIEIYKLPKEKRENMWSSMTVFFYILLSLILVLVFENGTSIICRDYPKLVIFNYGFAFAHLNSRLMIATVTNESYFNQYRPSIVITCLLLGIGVIVNYYTNVVYFNLDYIIPCCLVFNFLSWLIYSDKVSKEIADTEGIYRFKLGKANEKTE